MKATTIKKPKQEVAMFTDAMHKDIFPFQPGISSRGWGGSKPITKTLAFKAKSGKK